MATPEGLNPNITESDSLGNTEPVVPDRLEGLRAEILDLTQAPFMGTSRAFRNGDGAIREVSLKGLKI